MKKSLLDQYITDYLKYRPAFYAFLRPQEALLFQKYLPFKRPVLDFGCGDGFFARVAFQKQGKIEFGLDTEPKIKKEAEESGAYGKVIIYDGNKLPFPDEYFASIISNCVLEHIPDLKNTLKELNRILKKGGRIYLAAVTDQWQDNLLGGEIFGEPYRKWFKKIQRHHQLLSHQQWCDSFIKMGFEVKETIPYMTKGQQRWCEIFHYLSFASLIGKKLLGRWVIGGTLTRIMFYFLVKKVSMKKGNNKSCYFIVLGKQDIDL